MKIKIKFNKKNHNTISKFNKKIQINIKSIIIDKKIKSTSVKKSL